MKQKTGFTLVELLIASAISAVIIISIYSAFQSGILSYGRLDSATTLFQTARSILNRAELDLVNAFAYKQEDAGFSGTSASLEFFSAVPAFIEGSSAPGVWRIKYALSRNTLQRIFCRGIDSLIADAEPSETEMSQEVKQISLRYAFPSGNPQEPLEWQDSWPNQDDAAQKKSLPAAVEISLSLIEKDRRQREAGSIIFTRVIPLAEGQAIANE